MLPRKKMKLSDGKAGDCTKQTSISDPVVTTDPEAGASRKFRMRKGCLKDIPSFAVELQLEIFGYLQPQDLFNLSRTCKAFHSFFLHRSNERLWEASLKNDEDLPPRPPWISIPAFIHLLYSPYCHNCAGPNVRKAAWLWFARYCSHCLPQVSCSAQTVHEKLQRADTVLQEQFRYQPECFLHGIDEERPKVPQRGGYNYNYHRQQQKRYFSRHVDQLIDKWKALPERKDRDVLKAFLSERSAELRVQERYARDCEKWYEERRQDRKDELQDVREQRFDAILRLLEETGWKKELDYLGEDGLQKMSRLPVVRQSTKLTDKGWEKVQDALDDFLNDTRAQRLKEEKDRIVKERFAELDAAIVAYCVTLPRNATMNCRPLAFDLAPMKELERLANAPVSKNVTRESFASIVPKLVDKWFAKQKADFESLLRPLVKCDRVPLGVDILDLAIAVFYLGGSNEPPSSRLRYPYILAQSQFRWSYGSEDLPSGHYARHVADRYNIPFTVSVIDKNKVERGIKWMRSILTALGLDPDRTTFAELEKCEGRLRCAKCKSDRRPDVVYAWEAAFVHTASSNSGKKTSYHNRWVRVKAADMARVKELEATAHEMSFNRERSAWCCSLCLEDWWSGKGNEIPQHLAQQHQIEDCRRAIEDGTVYLNPKCYALRKPPVTLPP
ncbi:hypothetical protein DICSQDRAFT_178812 [Dichomitus squalens LYAD-421 SS1]|uniref:uncharacterized protein n=1 Tax=Dichomitus squalens (strain LYAD-421) TaxID=732165 RepID=UPI00044133EE|nr:uncharacterized protein DICSQDRAFT_178812 [Dichomitus squalens LYAD-421 SS1]EJF64361.1 hypothetical protein DICSQDRAFT_178812 [Dichomitus squalens LYAD-421 SS1]